MDRSGGSGTHWIGFVAIIGSAPKIIAWMDPISVDKDPNVDHVVKSFVQKMRKQGILVEMPEIQFEKIFSAAGKPMTDDYCGYYAIVMVLGLIGTGILPRSMIKFLSDSLEMKFAGLQTDAWQQVVNENADRLRPDFAINSFAAWLDRSIGGR